MLLLGKTGIILVIRSSIRGIISNKSLNIGGFIAKRGSFSEKRGKKGQKTAEKRVMVKAITTNNTTTTAT